MAYDVTIEKIKVEKISATTYDIKIQMLVEDTGEYVFAKTVSKKFDSATESVSDVKAELQSKLVAAWDKYKAEQQIYNHAALDTMVTQIETAASNYVNS